MTKSDIVDAVAHAASIPKTKAVATTDMVFEIIRDRLEHGEEIKISGFGGFRIRKKAARPGRNPKTGEDAEIGARTVVAFKASGLLQERLNHKK